MNSDTPQEKTIALEKAANKNQKPKTQKFFKNKNNNKNNILETSKPLAEVAGENINKTKTNGKKTVTSSEENKKETKNKTKTSDNKRKEKVKNKKPNMWAWPIKVFFFSLVLTLIFSLASEFLLSSAGLAVSILIILFLIFERHIVEGVTMSGIKG